MRATLPTVGKMKVALLDANPRTGRHIYRGPVTFRGKCEACAEPRNRHCGHCHGCPGHHVATCQIGYQTGAWH